MSCKYILVMVAVGIVYRQRWNLNHTPVGAKAHPVYGGVRNIMNIYFLKYCCLVKKGCCFVKTLALTLTVTDMKT